MTDVDAAIEDLKGWDTHYSYYEEMRDNAIAALEALRAENERLRELLKECADEIEAECKAIHGFTGNNPTHPVSCRLYESDMVLVRAARAAIGERDE